jgi:hypothetical protein
MIGNFLPMIDDLMQCAQYYSLHSRTGIYNIRTPKKTEFLLKPIVQCVNMAGIRFITYRTAYSLPTHCLLTAYSLPTHCLLTAYSLPTHCLLTHCLLTAYSLPTHCLLTAYSLPTQLPTHLLTHCLLTAYSRPTHCLLTAYSLPLHLAAYALHIDCCRCVLCITSFDMGDLYEQLPIHCLFAAYSITSLRIHSAGRPLSHCLNRVGSQ